MTGTAPALPAQPFVLVPGDRALLGLERQPAMHTPFARNFRSFLAADVLRRWLESPLGPHLKVTQVMNITDVGHMTQDHLADATGEDKLAKAARELGQDPFQVAAHFERLFVEDAKQLRLKIYQGAEAENPDRKSVV